MRGNDGEKFMNHGVGDGIRTRDVQIHSLALYQLSYTHHLDGVARRSPEYLCNTG